jgi:hypothetical protein
MPLPSQGVAWLLGGPHHGEAEGDQLLRSAVCSSCVSYVSGGSYLGTVQAGCMQAVRTHSVNELHTDVGAAALGPFQRWRAKAVCQSGGVGLARNAAASGCLSMLSRGKWVRWLRWWGSCGALPLFM